MPHQTDNREPISIAYDCENLAYKLKQHSERLRELTGRPLIIASAAHCEAVRRFHEELAGRSRPNHEAPKPSDIYSVSGCAVCAELVMEHFPHLCIDGEIRMSNGTKVQDRPQKP